MSFGKARLPRQAFGAGRIARLCELCSAKAGQSAMLADDGLVADQLRRLPLRRELGKGLNGIRGY